MAQLGKAYIEVRADLSKFPTELRAELEKALKEGTAGVTFNELEDKAKVAGKDAANAVGDEFERTSKTRSKKAGEKAGKDIGLGLFGTIRKLFSSGSSNGGFFSGVGDLFKGLSNSAEDGAKQVSSAFDKVQEVGGKITSTFSAIGSGIQAVFIGAAIPAVIGLIGVLVQLSGALLALPAAIGVVVAAVAPLVIAFQGIGGAISAGFAGNAQKFNDALKQLAPAARSVVREIVGLKPAFESIKSSVQQAFFAPLVGSIKELGTTLLPALRRGLSLSAGALGNFAAQFAQLLTSPKFIATLNSLFQTTATILEDIAPTVVETFGLLFDLIKTGLPYVQNLADDFAVALQKFDDFLGSAIGFGKVNKLIEGAAQPFHELVNLVGIVGKLFFTIFSNPAIQKGGNDFILSLTKAIGLLQKFFASAEGQKVLNDLGDAARRAGLVMIGFAAAIIGVLEAMHYIEAGIRTAVFATLAFLQAVGQGAVTAVKAVGSFFATVGSAIGSFFTKTIPSAFNSVVGFFKNIGSAIGSFFTKTIPGWFNSLVNFFTSVPNKAGDGLKSLRQKILQAFEDAFNAVVGSVTRNIGRVIGLVLAAPFLIKASFEKGIHVIGDAFTEAFDFATHAVSAGIDAIGHFFSTTLPNAISSGVTFAYNFVVSQFTGMLTFLEGLGPKIGNFFVDVYHSIVDHISAAVTDARNFVVSGFNAIVDFFNGLPGKIAALGPKLLNAAKDLGKQIGNGLKDIGNFASDIGHDIVNTIKSGINKIIDGINSGIKDIDDKIPISLPRLPRFERGGIIDSPTVALLGEKNKREVVLPLTDPGRAQQLAQQSGLSKVLTQGASVPTVNITAILGTGQIIDILDQRVHLAFDDQGTELAYGTR
jgi:hypothetical protein